MLEVLQGGPRVKTRKCTCYVRLPPLHPSMSLICTTSSLLVNLSPPPHRSFSSGYCVYNEHFLQPPSAHYSLTFSPLLSCPPFLTVCRIGEAYRLATTIKVQQVSGGSSHHRRKLHKPSCDQQLKTEREENSESLIGRELKLDR